MLVSVKLLYALLFISTLLPNKKLLVKRKYVCSMYQLLLEWISKYPLFSAFPQNTVGSKRMRDEILFDTCRRCNPWKRYILFIFRKSTIDWRICISSKHVSTTLEYIWYYKMTIHQQYNIRIYNILTYALYYSTTLFKAGQL